MRLSGRFKRWVFCADLHGDMQEQDVVRRFHRWLEDFNPHIKVFGGDLWDFRALRKKAGEDEKRESMKEDYEMGMRFLKEYRPQHFLLGNHDVRLWDLAEQGVGPLQDLADLGVSRIKAEARAMGCRLYPYCKRRGILRIGHLKMLHGFAKGMNAARRHALSYGSCLFGHVHTIEQAPLERDEYTVARSVGCLCQLDMDYNRDCLASLRHRHGWAYGIVDEKTGSFWVWQAQEINGRWIIPSDFTEL